MMTRTQYRSRVNTELCLSSKNIDRLVRKPHDPDHLMLLAQHTIVKDHLSRQIAGEGRLGIHCGFRSGVLEQ
jgi:hypothetical protein